MVTVGTVGVNISAGTAAFNDGLNKATSMLSAFGSNATAIGTTVAAAFSAQKIWGGITSEMQRILDVSKLARQAGVGASAFSGLTFAAEKTGLSADELSHAFTRVERVIYDASVAGGEAETVFTRLGLKSQDLARLAPEEAFKRIADAVSRLSNQFEKADVAQKLFGRGGADLLNFLNRGRAGIEALQQKAAELGRTFSDLTAGEIREFKVAINDAVAVPKGIVGSFFSGVAAGIGRDIQQLKALINAKPFTGTVIPESPKPKPPEFDNNILTGMRVRNEQRLRDERDASAIVKSTRTAEEELTNTRERLLNLNLRGKISHEDYARAVEAAGLEFDRATGGSRDLARAIEEQIAGVGTSAKDLDLYRLASAGATQQDQARIAALHDQLAVLQKLDDESKKLKQFAEDTKNATKSPVEEFEEQITKIKKAFSEGLFDNSVFEKSLKAAADKLKSSAPAVALGGPTGAAELGSQEAFRTIHSINRSPVEQTLKDALKEAQKQTKLMEDEAKKTKDELVALKII